MASGNLLDVMILFGAVQGFITALLLLGKRKNKPNLLLACSLILISMACLNIYLLHTHPDQLPTFLRVIEKVVPLIIVMPLGPLIYFYVRVLAGETFRFKSEKYHFYPVLLDVFPSLIFLGCALLFAIGLIPSFEPEQLVMWSWAYEKYVDIPRWLSLSIYLVLAFRFIRQKRGVSNWAKQLLIVFAAFQLIWLVHLIPYMLPGASGWLLKTLGWYPIYIPLTILVYWLGINGLIQIRNHQPTPLDEKKTEATIRILKSTMEKQSLYLNPTLSLAQVIELTGIPQKEISKALNQYLGKSFNEWVNEYRVDEVKNKLENPAFDHLSLTGIALESGFNSQATFQRAFKNVTGSTPKAHRASKRLA